MLFLLTIIVLVIGVISFAVFAKRRLYPQLTTTETKRVSAAESFRPLFAPSEDELSTAQRETAAQVEMKAREHAQHTEKENLAAFEQFRQNWRTSPDRSNTIELLYQAAKSENGSIYLEVSDEVLRAWSAGTVADLSANDLAQIMESHFWLIPSQERTPGVSFRLKEEIAGLRRGALTNK